MKKSTIDQVLKSAEGRELVETLEDVLVSLEDKDGDTILEEMRDDLIATLKAKFGFQYKI